MAQVLTVERTKRCCKLIFGLTRRNPQINKMKNNPIISLHRITFVSVRIDLPSTTVTAICQAASRDQSARAPEHASIMPRLCLASARGKTQHQSISSVNRFGGAANHVLPLLITGSDVEIDRLSLERLRMGDGLLLLSIIIQRYLYW